MISPFNDGLETLLLGRDEPCHVPLQQETKRRLPLEEVSHERRVAASLEFMDVPQARERTAYHLIDETSRPIDFNDLRCESLAYSEVTAFERHEIAELQNARCSSGLDETFARKRSALGVQIDIQRGIETNLRRRSDQRLDCDGGQALSARRLIARSHERRMMSLPGWITRQ